MCLIAVVPPPLHKNKVLKGLCFSARNTSTDELEIFEEQIVKLGEITEDI